VAAGVGAPPIRATDVRLIDAVTGAESARDDVVVTRDGDGINIRFRVPDQTNGRADKSP
jgi:hypothetical protein